MSAIAAQRFTREANWLRDPLWTRARMVPAFDLDANWGPTPIDRVSGLNLTTFTRTASATYVDSDGSIQTAGTNVLRRQWDATNRRWGWLVEEARTNLLLRSEEFDNASWTKSGASASANSTTSPSGSNTADTIAPSATTAFHAALQSTTVVASTAYVASVYVKSNGAPFVQLVYDNGSSVGAYINVNLSTGAVTRGPESAGGATSVNGTVQPLSNGWYRISVGATHSGTVGRVIVSPLPAGSSTAGINASTTTTAGDAIFIWGAQLEAGAFPTSYIPTTGTTATRDADVWTVTGSNFSRWYNQSEGALLVDYIGVNNVTGSMRRVCEIGVAGSTSDRMIMGYNTTALSRFLVVAGGASQADITPSVTQGSQVKAAASFAANDFRHVANSTVGSADTSGSVPTVSAMAIGADFNLSAGTVLNGTISRLTYWPRRLPDAVLQELTR